MQRSTRTINKVRCTWTGDDPLYIRYHDKEWGIPKSNDQVLFEKLILEGFQAGLSWITILRKRGRFREVFNDFNAEKIVHYNERKVETMMSDAGIIRNRLKIESAITNARAFLDLKAERSLGAFLWDFVDGFPVQNNFEKMSEIPAETETSKKMSKALKQRGFRFCGPTIMYAFMQSVGMVNDHVLKCHCHEPCKQKALKFRAPQK